MDASDRPNRHEWPPMIYLGVLLAAVALHWALPLPGLRPGLVLRSVGGVMAAASLALGGVAILTFRRARTTVNPTGRPRVLVTEGVFARTRNPMYLAATGLYLGLGAALGWPWLSLLALTMPIWLTRLAIRREEAWLAAHFEAEWREYSARVGRWW